MLEINFSKLKKCTYNVVDLELVLASAFYKVSEVDTLFQPVPLKSSVII